MTPHRPALEGRTIGSYRLERFLAAGGMGSVWAATDLASGNRAAVKVLHASLSLDEREVARFQGEASASARVVSPHVVRVLAAGVDPRLGVPWLAMELLDGETLAARLARAPLPALPEALAVLGQIARGLDAAHAARLAHRDLKPENVFLSSDGVVKILDFGIAKVLRERGVAATTAAIGSPAWMAPEQIEAGRVSDAVDLWSYGLVAYALFTGRSFWRSVGPMDARMRGLLVEILSAPIPPASERAAHHGVALPAGLDGWFARCLVRDPAARFPTAGEAFRELERALAGPAPSAEAPPPEQVRHAGGGVTRAALAVSLAAALLCVTALVLWLRSGREDGRRRAAHDTTADPSGASSAQAPEKPSKPHEAKLKASVPPTGTEFRDLVVAPCWKTHEEGPMRRFVVKVKLKADGEIDEVNMKPLDEGGFTLNLVNCIHGRAGRLRYADALGTPATFSYMMPPPSK